MNSKNFLIYFQKEKKRRFIPHLQQEGDFSHNLLNVDIFVDDGGSYRLHQHKLILFVRNGYNKTDEDFIPISIERNPQIMKRKSLIKLLPKDLSEVRTFIKQNLVNLYNLADRQISQIEFSLKIDKITRATNEARGFLTNMKKVFN